MTRAAMDWDEAFTYYASLPDGRRTYREVAERFGVSDRTVERHGRDGRWRARVQRQKRDAARTVDEELTAKQVKNLTDQIGLVEETFDCYAHQLQAGTVKVTPSDLARMVALYQQLGDALATLAHRVPTDATMASATVEQQLEHKLGVVRNLLRAGQLDDLLRELDRTGSNGDISDEEDPR